MSQSSSNGGMNPAAQKGLLAIVLAVLGMGFARAIGGTAGLFMVIALMVVVAIGASLVARAQAGSGRAS